MKHFPQIQIALLALLVVEGGVLLMKSPAVLTSAGQSVASDCRTYDEVTVTASENTTGTSVDELLKSHAAAKQKAADILTKANVAVRISGEDMSILAEAPFDDGQSAGLLDSIANAVKPVPTQLRLDSTVQYHVDVLEKGAELTKLFIANNLMSELRLAKGDSCAGEKPAEPTKKEVKETP